MTRVAYEVDGWGVGELWAQDGRLLQLEHPTAGRPRRRSSIRSCRGSRPTSRASASRSTTSRSTSTGARRSSASSRRRSARVPWGEVVTYGELAALAGRPGRARAAGTFCAQNRFGDRDPVPPRRRRGRDRRVRLARPRLQAAAARARGSRAVSPLSEDLRDELAAIAPRRDCDRLAELSGLFHAAGSAHLRGRGEISLHLDLSSSAVARRAFRLLRELGVESEIRTYRRHAFEQATRYQLHVEGKQRALQVLARGGRARPAARPARAAAEARRRAPVLPRRLPARRAARRRLAQRPARAAPRAARRQRRGGRVRSPRSPRAKG